MTAMSPLVLSAFSAVNALGRGSEALFDALQARRSGLAPCDFDGVPLATYVGRVAGLEQERVTARLADFECRNNRLAQLALETDGFAQAVAAARVRYGAERVAVILGTSTSGILATEEAYRRRDAQGCLPDYRFRETHNLFSASDFVRRYLDLRGPALMISTACSSSAKVFASAQRMLAQGVCDAAVVGGVDSLCRNTLYGFSSLDLVAAGPCRPCSADRNGISIGEAAGFALLERPERAEATTGIALYGYGESADAYHMSTPRPDGAGAMSAMQQALARAGLAPSDIGYINMHGTASQVNDAMEDKAITALLGRETPASSTKGWTGHTLGAAGITEAIISALALTRGLLPGCLNTNAIDPTFTSRVLLDNLSMPVRYVVSNSFGFGGSNCSLVFGRRT